MSDLSLARLRETQREVARVVTSKTVVIDPSGGLSVDGIHLQGLDGQRALQFFFGEGIALDIKRNGQVETEALYRARGRETGGLRKVFRAAKILSQLADAEEVIGR